MIETGLADTDHSTALWVPDLRLIVAGDVGYNGIHQYMGEADAATRREWMRAADKLAPLDPVFVVPDTRGASCRTTHTASLKPGNTWPTSTDSRPKPQLRSNYTRRCLRCTQIGPTPARCGAGPRKPKPDIEPSSGDFLVCGAIHS